jgi:hypothetical protein
MCRHKDVADFRGVQRVSIDSGEFGRCRCLAIVPPREHDKRRWDTREQQHQEGHMERVAPLCGMPAEAPIAEHGDGGQYPSLPDKMEQRFRQPVDKIRGEEGVEEDRIHDRLR